MKTLVLCSGGLKSAILASLAAKEGEVVLLFYNYKQQAHAQEVSAAQHIALHYHTKLEFFHIAQSTISPSKEETLWVAFQTLEMIMGAMRIAKMLQCDMVYYGASNDDKLLELSSECQLPIRRAVELAQPAYENHSYKLISKTDVQPPLLYICMADIIKRGVAWNAPLHLAWSCERPEFVDQDTHCGVCEKCQRRRKAFKIAGVKDPVYYVNDI